MENTVNGLTISEKILSRAAGMQVRAGDIAICTPDLAMGTDGSIPMALDYLERMRPGDSTPSLPQRLVFALDHYGQISGQKALSLQARARAYAVEHNIHLYDEAEGIGHQLILESGAARPGLLMVGADSHSTSYGAVNAFATGIGSSDLAGVLLCGQLWLKVPETISVILHGALRAEVSAKDVALFLARLYGADGASYRTLEFSGPGVAQLDMDDRIVLSNMSVELGAKAGIFPFDEVTRSWLQERTDVQYDPVIADDNACYSSVLELDLGAVVPQLALPHRVDNVIDADQVPYTAVDMVYLGTCTGGRVKDYQEALTVLQEGGGIAKGVRVVVTPASERVRAELDRSGMLAAFSALGAEIQAPGCGSCCGTCGTIPASGEKVISTANRNFKGRMGNAAASIYLASPRVCAMAAVRGGVGTKSEGKQ
ncbi:homoaconitate hydratase family protein [Glaciimonas sp. GS1]|uniref:Homoaconitate hydratase family protein n=2 Tax=Glaciimonas soli TaxID=2590999 RepID=A0A843YVS2_9BURK|nr:homoaconitate hydratase family protein [Glaciimonas soli]